jgi:tetratricopeptide (TPR) repeat protein
MAMASSDYYIMDNADIEDKKLDAAKSLYATGNFSGALKLYLDMVNTSYSYKLYYEIGRCYYKLNELQQAELYFLQSTGLEDMKNPSFLFLGNIFYKKGETSKAIEHWITYYSYKPDDESVCLNLASAYFSKDMKFQALFYYEKYLKYAKNKNSAYYKEIYNSILEFQKIGKEFYQKALRALNMQDKTTAIQALEYSLKNYPIDFDTNLLISQLYLDKKQYMEALAHLKLAYCLDNKSFDVLDKLASTLIILGDYTSAYCVLKRTIPLIIKNQKKYLELIKTITSLENTFDQYSGQSHMEWAEKYYNSNNYYFALFEYENYLLISSDTSEELETKIQKLKLFINPEERIIKSCFEKGTTYYSNGEYNQANRYFTKILNLAETDSADYKLAKARITNV